MKDRIRKVMEWARLSQQDFASRLEISPASLSSIFNGRTNPTNNHVMAIHRAFPQIDINWLLFGEGEMMQMDGKERRSLVGNGGISVPESSSMNAEGGAVEPHGTMSSASETHGTPSLFQEADFAPISSGHPSVLPHTPRADSMSVRSLYARETENVKKMDKPARKIKEIRVFFDDGTYESFVPSSGK